MEADLVIFDCDGVLVDSEAIAIEIEAELLTAAGFPITAEDIAERFVGVSYADMMSTIAADAGRPVPERVRDHVQTRVIAAFPDRLRPVPGIPDVLDRLTVPSCVASSSDLDRVRLSLELTGLDRHFGPDRVFSAQMVRRGKPAPDLFLHAARAVGVEPDKCVVIEDSPHGVVAALAAGMHVIGFTGGGHARPSLRRRLVAAGATRIADDASDLPVA